MSSSRVGCCRLWHGVTGYLNRPIPGTQLPHREVITLGVHVAAPHLRFGGDVLQVVERAMRKAWLKVVAAPKRVRPLERTNRGQGRAPKTFDG